MRIRKTPRLFYLSLLFFIASLLILALASRYERAADFLNEKIPALAASVLDSESLWQWIENELLPNAKPQIETFIKSTGKDIIIKKLNISGRVTEAVDKQDVEEFHSMINSIAAQHLGAIQVLRYFLGAIVGATQIFIK